MAPSWMAWRMEALLVGGLAGGGVGPADLLTPPRKPEQRLFSHGPLQQKVLACARQLAAGAAHAADELTHALRAWATWQETPPQRERITHRRRRDTVQQARQWMATRLQGRFQLAELSGAVGVCPRQQQYSFLQELGRSPMAEAKRLRMQRLRSLLLDRSQNDRPISELMVASGLIASGVTSADYRHWCGESPRQTRLTRQFHDERTALGGSPWSPPPTADRGADPPEQAAGHAGGAAVRGERRDLLAEP